MLFVVVGAALAAYSIAYLALFNVVSFTYYFGSVAWMSQHRKTAQFHVSALFHRTRDDAFRAISGSEIMKGGAEGCIYFSDDIRKSGHGNTSKNSKELPTIVVEGKALTHFIAVPGPHLSWNSWKRYIGQYCTPRPGNLKIISSVLTDENGVKTLRVTEVAWEDQMGGRKALSMFRYWGRRILFEIPAIVIYFDCLIAYRGYRTPSNGEVLRAIVVTGATMFFSAYLLNVVHEKTAR